MSLEQDNSETTEDTSKKVTTTTNTQKISTERKVSGRLDIKTGKTYINEKEVSADEYNAFQSMSMKEQVQKYGQIQKLDTSDNTELQKSNQNQQLNTCVNTNDNINPQKDKISSENLKYDSNVNEGNKQIIVMTKTNQTTRIVPVTVAV